MGRYGNSPVNVGYPPIRWLDLLLPALSQAIWRRYARDFRALRAAP